MQVYMGQDKFHVTLLLNSPPPSFSEFYEPNALMMEEEGAVIAGLLVGLNVIDANLCMKGEDLDSQVLLLLYRTPKKCHNHMV